MHTHSHHTHTHTRSSLLSPSRSSPSRSSPSLSSHPCSIHSRVRARLSLSPTLSSHPCSIHSRVRARVVTHEAIERTTAGTLARDVGSDLPSPVPTEGGKRSVPQGEGQAEVERCAVLHVVLPPSHERVLWAAVPVGGGGGGDRGRGRGRVRWGAGRRRESGRETSRVNTFGENAFWCE